MIDYEAELQKISDSKESIWGKFELVRDLQGKRLDELEEAGLIVSRATDFSNNEAVGRSFSQNMGRHIKALKEDEAYEGLQRSLDAYAHSQSVANLEGLREIDRQQERASRSDDTLYFG